MKIRHRSTATVTIITLMVEDAPPMEDRMVAQYRRRPRLFQPKTLTIRVEGGRVESATFHGPVLLKSGGESNYSDSDVWRAEELAEETASPRWLRDLVRLAMLGAADGAEIDNSKMTEEDQDHA